MIYIVYVYKITNIFVVYIYIYISILHVNHCECINIYRHELNEKTLEAYLVANVAGFIAPLEIKQFKHGQSNPTYLIKDGK